MADQLFGGRRLRVLTIVDNVSRVSLFIGVGFRHRGYDVVTALNLAVAHYGVPECIRLDNGPEFISKEVDLWAYAHGVVLDFSRPGKPTDNAFIEAFNSRFRQECLNEHWFLSLEDARKRSGRGGAITTSSGPKAAWVIGRPCSISRGGGPRTPGVYRF
jgi:putative transposase